MTEYQQMLQDVGRSKLIGEILGGTDKKEKGSGEVVIPWQHLLHAGGTLSCGGYVRSALAANLSGRPQRCS
jgi:hypothetical protein